MKLTLAEPKYLKESVSIISELVNEGVFKITPDAIELIAMDPANVAMVIFKLLSSSFVEYDVKKEVELAINLSNLKQILRRAKPTDMLTLEVDANNRLLVQLKGNTIRTFSLPIIDIDNKEQKVPALEFPVTISTTSSILSEAIEDVDIVADSVSFMVENGKFIINAEGDLSNANIEIKSDDDTKIKSSKDKVKAKYSIEYLKKMIGAAKLSDRVTVQFNKDYPLKLEFKAVDKLMLSFILAPRVENE